MTSFIPTFHQSYMLIISQYKFLDLTLSQNPVLYHNLSPEYIPADVPKSPGIQHDTFEIHGLHSTSPLLPSSQILCILNSSPQSTASLSLIFQRSRCHPGRFSANTCKAAVKQTSPCLHGDLPPSFSPPLNGGLILSPANLHTLSGFHHLQSKIASCSVTPEALRYLAPAPFPVTSPTSHFPSEATFSLFLPFLCIFSDSLNTTSSAKPFSDPLSPYRSKEGWHILFSIFMVLFLQSQNTRGKGLCPLHGDRHWGERDELTDGLALWIHLTRVYVCIHCTYYVTTLTLSPSTSFPSLVMIH